jgi:hypothetical protein
MSKPMVAVPRRRPPPPGPPARAALPVTRPFKLPGRWGRRVTVTVTGGTPGSLAVPDGDSRLPVTTAVTQHGNDSLSQLGLTHDSATWNSVAARRRARRPHSEADSAIISGILYTWFMAVYTGTYRYIPPCTHSRRRYVLTWVWRNSVYTGTYRYQCTEMRQMTKKYVPVRTFAVNGGIWRYMAVHAEFYHGIWQYMAHGTTFQVAVYHSVTLPHTGNFISLCFNNC